MAYSDGEREDRRRKGNKTKKEPKHPFHHSRDNLTVTLRAIPGRRKKEKRTVSDKSPPAPEKQLSKKKALQNQN